MDTSEEEEWVLRLLDPPTFVLPSWAVETFEKHGGVFKGKQPNLDGTFTITGIEKFTDDYLRTAKQAVSA